MGYITIPYYVMVSGKRFRIETIVRDWEKGYASQSEIIRANSIKSGNYYYYKQTIVSDGNNLYISSPSFFRPKIEGNRKNYNYDENNWDGKYVTDEKPLGEFYRWSPTRFKSIWWGKWENKYEIPGRGYIIFEKKGAGEVIAGCETIKYEGLKSGTSGDIMNDLSITKLEDLIDKTHNILLKSTRNDTWAGIDNKSCFECKQIKIGPVNESYFIKP